MSAFVDRALKKVDFISRVITISSKVPNDWYQLTQRGLERVRQTFHDADVDVMLAVGEIFCDLMKPVNPF